MNGSNQVPLIQTGEMPDGTPIFHSLSKDWSEALDLPSLNSSVLHLDLSSVSQITIPFLITGILHSYSFPLILCMLSDTYFSHLLGFYERTTFYNIKYIVDKWIALVFVFRPKAWEEFCCFQPRLPLKHCGEDFHRQLHMSHTASSWSCSWRESLFPPGRSKPEWQWSPDSFPHQLHPSSPGKQQQQQQQSNLPSAIKAGPAGLHREQIAPFSQAPRPAF